MEGLHGRDRVSGKAGGGGGPRRARGGGVSRQGGGELKEWRNTVTPGGMDNTG